MLRDELKLRNLPETRQHLIDVGNDLRRVYGADILAERVVTKLLPNQNIVVDSIRHPFEVERLIKIPDRQFILIAIDTPDKLRFDCLMKRKRFDDLSITHMDQFLKIQEQERANPQAYGQQLNRVMNMATISLKNDSTLDVFIERIRYFCETCRGCIPLHLPPS